MTEAQLRTRVELWQKRLALLGVGHWRFTLKVSDAIADRPENNPQAKADTHHFYDTVDFEFTTAAIQEHIDAGTLDEVVVHEWLHAADRTQDEIVYDLLEQLPPAARDLVEKREEAARERRVDNLARLIVSLHE